MKTVNAKGLKEIQGYLSDLHKQETFTDEQVSAWAAQVEDSLNSSGYPMFVIAAADSKSGVDEICYIDDEGYDIEYFDMDPTPRGRNHHDRNDCERYACRICVAFGH
tara:strand:+ start:66 stop:386 length:321 start_codon:yes stop_codon:yes gene_type:complete